MNSDPNAWVEPETAADRIKEIFGNKEKHTPFAPVYSIPFWNSKILIEQEAEYLTKTILDKEESIIRLNPHLMYDGGTGLGPDSLTAKFPAYNILKWDDYDENYVVRKLKIELHYAIAELCHHVGANVMELKPWAQCWANVMRKGQKINPHQHSGDGWSFLSGNLSLQVSNTSTVYQDPYTMNSAALENEVGTLTLFPEYVVHWTTEHQSDVERVTLGIDILTEESLYNAPDRKRNPDHFFRLY